MGCCDSIHFYVTSNMQIYKLPLIMLDIYVQHSSPIYILLNRRIQIIDILFTSRVQNRVDPDQLASEKPADLDLHSFQNRVYPSIA